MQPRARGASSGRRADALGESAGTARRTVCEAAWGGLEEGGAPSGAARLAMRELEYGEATR